MPSVEGPTNPRNALRLGLANASFVLACLLAAHPFAEIPMTDDWSYIKTARVFAQTGRFQFNGWANMTLGWQAPWGALFIRFFGPSYSSIRLSTIVVAFLCIVLFHLCAARFGIRPFNAVVGGLALGLSPLFLPLAASFMNDINGLFCLLLCLYLCQLALVSRTPAQAIGWLTLATASNVLDGTVRQTAWLGALVMVPAAGWLLRSRHGVYRATVALFVASAVSIALLLHWFNGQPYMVPEHLIAQLKYNWPIHLFKEMLSLALCLGLVLLPVLIAWLPTVGKLRGRRRLLVWGLVLLFPLPMLAAVHLNHLEFVMPWLQNVLDSQGLFPISSLIGAAPVTLGLGARMAVSMAVVLTGLTFLAWLRPEMWQSSVAEQSIADADGVLNWSTMVWMLGLFLTAYVCMLIPRAMVTLLFDRYILAVLPFLLMLLLRLHQRTTAPRLPAISLITLCLFSLFAEAGVHDWFATMRARAAELAALQATGIPRTQIEAGWESDAMAQIDLADHINNPLIQNPPGAYQPLPPAPPRPAACVNWFAEFTPVIAARYVFVNSPQTCFGPSEFPPVQYSAWAPPFHRTFYVQRVPTPSP